MRARHPDVTGTLERDGIGVHFEVHGDGGPNLLLLAASPITHSRSWKAQVPYLARRHRVITIDGRGNGASDRPLDASAHHRRENLADIIGVIDALAIDDVVVVAHCHANWWGVELAARHPGRVRGLVSIAPGVPYVGDGHEHWRTASATFDETLRDPVGWALYNRRVIENEPRRWLEFFFDQLLPESHSSKQLEDMLGWGLETSGAVLVAGEEGPELDMPERDELLETCRQLELPMLVIHGELDACQPVGRGVAFADLTGADLIVLAGAGHLPQGRHPVRVNLAIAEFVERLQGGRHA